MLIEETLQKLMTLKMPAMVQATRELMESTPSHQLSFEDKLAIIVDRGHSATNSFRFHGSGNLY